MGSGNFLVLSWVAGALVALGAGGCGSVDMTAAPVEDGGAGTTGVAGRVGTAAGSAGTGAAGEGAAGAWPDGGAAGVAGAPDALPCAPRALAARWRLTSGGKTVTCGEVGATWVSLQTVGKDPFGAEYATGSWNLPCKDGGGTTAASFANGPAGTPVPNEMVPAAGPASVRLVVSGLATTDKRDVVVPECGTLDLGEILVALQ